MPRWPRRNACLPDIALIAGGKSFGGRMTSQAQAKAPLEGVHGLAFLGFPLHPAGRPSQDRAEHLFEVQIPMLFLQGTRDNLASLDQLEPVCKQLGKRATLTLFADADHSFHVPARTGRKDAQVLDDVLDALAAWLDSVILRPAQEILIGVTPTANQLPTAHVCPLAAACRIASRTRTFCSPSRALTTGSAVPRMTAQKLAS